MRCRFIVVPSVEPGGGAAMGSYVPRRAASARETAARGNISAVTVEIRFCIFHKAFDTHIDEPSADDLQVPRHYLRKYEMDRRLLHPRLSRLDSNIFFVDAFAQFLKFTDFAKQFIIPCEVRRINDRPARPYLPFPVQDRNRAVCPDGIEDFLKLVRNHQNYGSVLITCALQIPPATGHDVRSGRCQVL